MFRLLYCGIALCLFFSAYANNGSLNLSLPGAAGSYQSDSFRADGLDCSMAIGSATNLEFGVVGFVNRGTNTVTTDANAQPNKDVGVYARLTVPIGAPRTRLDCNELYQLELRKKRMEVIKLEKELNDLKNLRFENSTNK